MVTSQQCLRRLPGPSPVSCGAASENMAEKREDRETLTGAPLFFWNNCGNERRTSQISRGLAYLGMGNPASLECQRVYQVCVSVREGVKAQKRIADDLRECRAT